MLFIRLTLQETGALQHPSLCHVLLIFDLAPALFGLGIVVTTAVTCRKLSLKKKAVLILNHVFALNDL